MKKHSLIIILFIFLCTVKITAQNLVTAQRWIKDGNSLREARQFDESEIYLLKGEKAVKRLNNSYWQAVAAEYLGLLYNSIGDAAAAKRYFTTALNLYRVQNLQLSISAIKSIMNDRDIVTDNSWQYYGGIDIGSRGVKYSIIKVRRKQGHFNFVYLKDAAKNTQVIDFTRGAIYETAIAVKAYLDTILNYNSSIKMENIFIAVSSGVKQETDKTYGREDILRNTVASAIPAYKKRIEFLDPCTEGDLTIKGVLPADYLFTSSLIEVGSGNTKGGYRLKDSKVAECFSIPWGTTTLSKRINKIPKADVEQFFTDSINRSIVDEVAKKTGLTDRKYAFFGGGIFWAICNYLYPEKIKDDFTEFTLQDVNKVLKAANTNYENLIQPDFSMITDGNELAEAEKLVARTNTTFNKDNIIAGTLLVRGILSEMQRLGVSGKHFIFSRYAYVGWISGYIVKKVDDDFKKLK